MKKDNASSTSSLLSRWKNRKNKTEQKSGITQIPDATAIPLSKEQKRLWFLQQLNPNNSFYNYAELYRLEGNLDIIAFEKSIRVIENRHDILRSTYPIEEGIPTVKIANTSQSVFNFIDYSNHAYELASEKANNLISKKSKHTFKLSEEPLLQTTVIKVAENTYLFLIVMHHIITDKWSMKVFRKELADNYEQLLKGVTPKQAPLNIQYSSYAYWQQKQPVNKEHLAYWQQKLAGNLPTLNISTDYPKKTQPSYKGAFHKKTYSKETSNSFFDLCKKMGTTPYVTMLSVYYVLLQKYSGQQDILIGTPITKREQTNLENLIGFFNDTLVLRNTVAINTSFSTLIESVKKTTLDAFSNKDISFDTLVKTIKPKRSLGEHPFFKAMFLYHKVPETPILGNNIKISYEPYDAGVAKFDLTLYISEDNDALMSLMEYATDLFAPSTIVRMHEHFEIILKKVINNPDAIIEDIQLHTDKEIQFYNSLETSAEKSNIKHLGIHEIIAEQAEKKPNAVAVVFKDTKITYKELNDRATKIATELIAQGIKENDIVGLCITRSENMIVGLLGILKSGAAYLPLDPEYPSERIAYILNNANARSLLTEQKLQKNFAHSTVKLQILETLEGATKNNKTILPKVKNNNKAYVIYTSGSTGTPKGVPISHENIIHSTFARTNFYTTNPSAFLLMSSISFDSSKAGIFWSLCTGGTLVISEKHLEQDIDHLANTIYKNSVSHTLMLPSLYDQVIQYADLKKLTSLQTVIVAGEACSHQLITHHFDKLPNVQMYNEYGPTESTVWCIAHKLKETDAQKRNVPIGTPISNTYVFILDKNLQRVPYGSIGELYIGGQGLATGYLNDPKKTATSFIKHPFSKNTTDRVYKTGDLAKYAEDGTIVFLGRKDTQVKIRGYRIELDEIEQLIATDNTVEQTVVSIENEIDAINWDTLIQEDPKKTATTLNKYFSNTDIEQMLTSVEALSEEALDLVIKNLD